MTKAEQFLWCVQTALLSNQMGLSRQFETQKINEFLGLRHVHSVTRRALWAASEIPEEMSPSTAAEEFCGHAFDNLWSEGKDCPEWLKGMPT
ncbi:hypothetical protein [Alcaligenes phenolicus]|uniref:hypothetical protein n=1 Tax=Alcaligenes phenolicus TaxID=232846 RepID=UPI002AA6C22E|nr:hypothetical protein [Alcaligenes phenolicus]